MADQVDVEEALGHFISDLLYPNGAAQPSVIGSAVRVQRGWPKGADVDKAMIAGLTLITIYPRGDTEKNTTRYPSDWQTSVEPVHTVAVAIDNQGSRFTFSGTVSATPPQYVTAVVGTDKVYTYTFKAGDTLTAIAAGLAALIAVDFPATSSSGPVLSIVGPISTARIGSTGTSWREVGRQEQWFQIVVWAPTDAIRTAVAKLIDPQLRDVKRLVLSDLSYANVCYVRTIVEDTVEKESVFRRDFIYAVDYPTTITETDYEVTTIHENIGPTQNPTPPRQTQI